MSIAIIGGGIGGLAAALALLQRGFEVDVYEQASELRELGAGVQATPNGAKVLMALGLQQDMDSLGTSTTGKEAYHWRTGEVFPFQRLGKSALELHGAPYLTFHRADLHDALRRAVLSLKPDALHLGFACTDIAQDTQSVTLSFANGQQRRAASTVGADGVHSRVRQQLLGATPTEFTGVYAWRGLIPAQAVPQGVNINGGGMWLGSTAHIITYPIRQRSQLNFVGLVDSDRWQVESWSTVGTVQECLADFPGWHPHVEHMIRSIPVLHKWALVVRRPLESWSRGRVTLLGDAAHPTLPFLSQGANMAMEDALVLARCLQQQAQDPQAAFLQYEQSRIERTSRIVRSSAEQVRRVHAPELESPETARPYIVREWASAKVQERYDWIWGYDARHAALGQPA